MVRANRGSRLYDRPHDVSPAITSEVIADVLRPWLRCSPSDTARPSAGQTGKALPLASSTADGEDIAHMTSTNLLPKSATCAVARAWRSDPRRWIALPIMLSGTFMVTL